MPHNDIAERGFEIRSGVFGLALLAPRRGPFDPAMLGAAAACAPDLEHVFPWLRPRGRKLFHGGRGWHRAGGLGTNVQLFVAGAIIGALVGARPRRESVARPVPRAA